MSTLELPPPDEAVFTEDEDESEDEYRERQYQDRDDEDYQNGEGDHHHGRDEDDYSQRQETNDDLRREEYEREDRGYDHGDINGGYETQTKRTEVVTNEEKDLGELEVYRSICDNLRDTLARIKNYSKVNLMGDAKASYFTIVDAVLSGPRDLTASQLTSVLGVSENTLGRVRRLGERLGQETATAEHKMSRRLRHRNSESNLGRGTLSASDGAARRRRSSFATSSSVTRPRKRSQSAQPGVVSEPEVGDVKESVVHHLHRQFQSYSRLGDRRSDGSHISCSQSDKWLKQARIIDGRTLTTVDTTIMWKQMCKANIWMNFTTWLKFIEEISEARRLDLHDVREALVLCGKPSRPILPFAKSSGRLTDVTRYGGTHRLRFDSNGQGLGVAGRRDIREGRHVCGESNVTEDLPMLWPQPTSDGFMMSLPSVYKVGREGATSPTGRRRHKLPSLSYCPI